MNKDLTQIHKEWWYNCQRGRYQRFCAFCDHCQNTNGLDKRCNWYETDCYEAARFHCPIPSAGVAMVMESEATFNAHIVAISQRKKGGTVVPPSDFQSVSTECTDTQQFGKKTPRPRGSARAHTGDEPQAPTQISAQICGEKDCPYYGHQATYCLVCSKIHDCL